MPVRGKHWFCCSGYCKDTSAFRNNNKAAWRFVVDFWNHSNQHVNFIFYRHFSDWKPLLNEQVLERSKPLQPVSLSHNSWLNFLILHIELRWLEIYPRVRHDLRNFRGKKYWLWKCLTSVWGVIRVMCWHYELLNVSAMNWQELLFNSLFDRPYTHTISNVKIAAAKKERSEIMVWAESLRENCMLIWKLIRFVSIVYDFKTESHSLWTRIRFLEKSLIR